MRTFKLNRKTDVSGVSGTGIVAEGVEFHDGQVVLSWFGNFHGVEVSPNISTVEQIHGHGGRTVVEWDEDAHTRTKTQLRILRKYISAGLSKSGIGRIQEFPKGVE